MMQCISEPISWLRLERYGLQQVSSSERQAISAHLEACAACRACLEHMERGGQTLRLPLPAAKPRSLPKRSAARRFIAWAPVAAAALAALVLLARRPDQIATRPPSVKGGEFALELVRVAADGQQREPSHFGPDERWKALLTCPADQSGYAQLVVYQAGRAYAPLDAERLPHCGNRLSLHGAFTLSGAEPAQVCVVLSREELDREQLERGAALLPAAHVCRDVEPAP